MEGGEEEGVSLVSIGIPLIFGFRLSRAHASPHQAITQAAAVARVGRDCDLAIFLKAAK